MEKIENAKIYVSGFDIHTQCMFARAEAGKTICACADQRTRFSSYGCSRSADESAGGNRDSRIESNQFFRKSIRRPAFHLTALSAYNSSKGRIPGSLG